MPLMNSTRHSGWTRLVRATLAVAVVAVMGFATIGEAAERTNSRWRVRLSAVDASLAILDANQDGWLTRTEMDAKPFVAPTIATEIATSSATTTVQLVQFRPTHTPVPMS